MMNNQVLQCLNESKLLLMYAQDGQWDEFILLHPKWNADVEECLLNEVQENSAPELKTVLEELISDVDSIRAVLKERIHNLERDFSNDKYLKKAVDTYLK